MDVESYISPDEIHLMRRFIWRLLRTTFEEIVLTGNPETDINADLLRDAEPGPNNDWSKWRRMEKLPLIEAARIEAMISGHFPHMTNIPEGVRRFKEMLALRVDFYNR